jgi:hypothetical protein
MLTTPPSAEVQYLAGTARATWGLVWATKGELKAFLESEASPYDG